jgi:hypothetical protein
VPVTLNRHVATLTGVVTVDDAEPLAQWLRGTTRPKVRLTGCTHLHTAALQALLAARPAIVGRVADPFLARWIAPLLAPEPVPVAADEEVR